MGNVPSTPIIVVAACIGGLVVLAIGWIAVVTLSRPRNQHSPQPLEAIRHDDAGNLSNADSSWSQFARIWRLSKSQKPSHYQERNDQSARNDQIPSSQGDKNSKAQSFSDSLQQGIPKRISWPSPTYSKRSKIGSRMSYLALEPINERGSSDNTPSNLADEAGGNDNIPLRDLCGSSRKLGGQYVSTRGTISNNSTLKRSMSLQTHPGKAPSQPVPSPSKHNARISKTQSLRRPTDRTLARHSIDSVASVNSSILNGAFSPSSRTELLAGNHLDSHQEDSQKFLVTLHRGGEWEWSRVPMDENLSSSPSQFSFRSHGGSSTLNRLSNEHGQGPRLTRSKSSALSMSLLTDALTPARTLSRAGETQTNGSRLLRYQAALSSTKHSERNSKIPVASDAIKRYGEDDVRQALRESFGNSSLKALDHKLISLTQSKPLDWGHQQASQTSPSGAQDRNTTKHQDWPVRVSSQAQAGFQDISETISEGDKENEDPRSPSPGQPSPEIGQPKGPRPPSVSMFDPEIRISKSPMATPQKQMQLFKAADTDENSPFRIYGHSLTTPTLKPGIRRSQVDPLRNSQKYPPACLLPPARSGSSIFSTGSSAGSDRSEDVLELLPMSHRRALPKTPGQGFPDRRSIISRARRPIPASKSPYTRRSLALLL